MNKIVIKLGLFTATVIFAAIQVIILNTYSTSGERLTTLQTEINTIEAENIGLSQKIASVSAIAQVSQKVHSYGFIYSATPVSLGSAVPVALRQDLRL